MLKIITLAMLVGGTALIIYGIGASQSLTSSLSKFFTGAPTEKAIWMLFAGVALVVFGFVGYFRGGKTAI